MIDKQFLADVDSGLSLSPKRLQSKYFYDDRGSELFREIMELDEYYLTRAEMEILQNRSAEIIKTIGESKLNVIELGAGDGSKTLHLLTELLNQRVDTTFIPIDISDEAMQCLLSNIKKELPQLCVKPAVGDYFEVLNSVYTPNKRELVLFLGANIGNYDLDHARELLKLIANDLKPGDLLLIGIDLKKNPGLIAKAYNDGQGVTRAFNLNLLNRMNRELGADFNLENFDFYSHYNPVSGEVRSYLVSKIEQKVKIRALSKSFNFQKDELVYTELSKKYSEKEIFSLAEATGFSSLHQFTDSNEYFAECLFVKV